MEFKAAPLDKPAAFISAFTTLFLIAMSVFFIIKVPAGWIFAALMMLLIVTCYLLSPKRYFIEGGILVIEKVIGKKNIIPLNEIEACISVADFIKLKPIRLFGNGGLFGYYGLFSTGTYGRINCQLTALKNILILRSKKGSFAISPVDPSRMQDYIRSIATNISDAIEPAETIATDGQKRVNPLILIVPGTIFMLTVIMVSLFYMQMPDRIATHFDFNGNANGWGPKSSTLTFGLIPSVVLFILNIIIFFSVRKRLAEPRTAYFIVFIFSLGQLFVAYAAFDIFWFNIFGAHWIAINYVVFGFLVLFILSIFLYYRLLKKKAG